MSAEALVVLRVVVLPVLGLAALLNGWRILRGPTLADRVVGLELLTTVGIAIAACAALAAADGHLVFSTINRNPKSYLLAVVGAEYVLGILPKGTHEYQKFIKPAELAGAVRAAGLEVQEIVGMRYNPFTRTCTLVDDVDVNYLLYARKP